MTESDYTQRANIHLHLMFSFYFVNVYHTNINIITLRGVARF